jgi:ABC-type molybdenum transport system ATPase subunit/photorepair protein PhrA
VSDDLALAAPDDASGAGSDEGVLAVHDVSVVREGTRLLDGISLTVRAGEHWALVGPNGAGKTTLFGILGARQFPTRGSASVLGRALGTVDLRELRALVGQVDQRFDASLPITVHDVVLTGATGTPLPLLHREIPAAEEARARDLETLLGIRTIAPRKWHVISAGERSRTLIARSLMPAPRLLLRPASTSSPATRSAGPSPPSFGTRRRSRPSPRRTTSRTSRPSRRMRPCCRAAGSPLPVPWARS